MKSGRVSRKKKESARRKSRSLYAKCKNTLTDKVYPLIKASVTILKFIELSKPYWLKLIRIIHIGFLLIATEGDTSLFE